MTTRKSVATAVAAGMALTCVGLASVQASSHKEAPFITELPKVDNTDVYAFRSYESGREDYVTLIANFIPFQDPFGGPNFYALDEDALYEIKIDNDGDALEDMTFQFRFDNEFRNLAVPAGTGTDGQPVENPVAVINIGPIDEPADANLNRIERYTIDVKRGHRGRNSHPVTNAHTGGHTFIKPVSNIGQKSIPDYQAYAQQHMYTVAIPGCDMYGRAFVGQRREGFFINISEIFDLINIPPGEIIGARTAAENILDAKNVTSLALEVPTHCLVDEDPVIGVFATASLPKNRMLKDNPTLDEPEKTRGPYVQVSRLGNPLVNEVVIGNPDKNLFNASEPVNDVENFGNYVLFPTLPVLVNQLFGFTIPDTPRTDLLQAFVTGIPGLTKPANVNLETLEGAGEMMRLNTGIPPNPSAVVGNLGFLECDLAGFPNGRRPIDDVVDIELTAAEGAITPANPNGLQTCDLSGGVENATVVNMGSVVTDGAAGSPDLFLDAFPYLGTPLPGSPIEAIAPGNG